MPNNTLILISQSIIPIRTMLEETHPNLHKDNLCRLANFRHKFGHRDDDITCPYIRSIYRVKKSAKRKRLKLLG